eukprot:TRINITY_DN73773_c0_g1_i1.p1 TRINITY_DN73773_c0_g1~~TRINITY_DN73773_c0_g1_i1.p1  ORF type:complete len:1014 (-),score=151.58 TRINITY_DN73773_c0_g1_i1:126-3167(-)
MFLFLAVRINMSRILIVAAALATAGTATDHLAGLELQDGATDIDIQIKYKSLVTKYASAEPTQESIRALSEVQKSYDMLSDFAMREEALEFLNYWAAITYISSDDDLRRFAELQPGGSLRLRVIFVVGKPEMKVFEAYSAAMRLFGRARVAQVCHKEMFDHTGQLGRFYTSLKVFEGGVILFDPVSRASKISYEVGGVAGDMERLLGGDSGTSKLARVQEFESRAYATRCGTEPSVKCSWSLVVATDAAFEAKRGEVAQLMKQFTDACKSLQVMEKYPWLACFWLRLDRSPEWRGVVAKTSSDPLVEGKPIAFAMRRDQPAVVVAPAGEALPESVHKLQLTTQESARWSTFDGVAMYSVGLTRFFESVGRSSPPENGPFPSLPRPMRLDEEPTEPFMEVAMRLYQKAVDCASDSACVIMLVDRGLVLAGVTSFESSDGEKKTMIIGTGIASLMLFVYILRKCCCCCCCASRKPVEPSEEGILRNMHLLLQVPLVRQSRDEKFGLGIEPDSDGGLTVNDVHGGGLVAKWNNAQARESGRVQTGDRIISVAYTKDGKDVVCAKSSDMTKAFQQDKLLLTVAVSRGETEVKILAGTVPLNGIDLKKDLELVEIEKGKGGMEVVKISEAIMKRNAEVNERGACLTQRIEVGDRIVISRATEALHHAVVAKIRFCDEVRSHTFDALVERKEPTDKLGMQVRQFPGSPKHMEVLDILADGMVARHSSQPGAEKVLQGDRLISANGKEGPHNMGVEFRSERIALRFERWIDLRGVSPPGGDGVVTANSGSLAPPLPTAPPQGFAMEPRGFPAALSTCTKAAPALAQAAPLLQPATAPKPSTSQPFVSPAAPALAPQQPAAFSAAPLQSQAFGATPTPVGPAAPVVAASTSSGRGALCFSLFVGGLLLAGAAFVGMYGSRPPPGLVQFASRIPRVQVQPIVMPPQTRRFMATIHPAMYGDIGVLCIFAGVSLAIYFLFYEISIIGRSHEGRVLSQVCVASLASGSFGFGSFFLLVWAGIYV